MVTPSLVTFSSPTVTYSFVLVLSQIICCLEGKKKKRKPEEQNILMWILPDIWTKPEDYVGWCRALLRKHVFRWICVSVEFSSIAYRRSVASLSHPCLSECLGGSVSCDVPAAWLATCMQQYAGSCSYFGYSLWGNMQKFVCLRPLAFCQIGWNCSTGSKCAWGKIVNWQMARQHSHICLVSWRTRLKMRHCNRLQEGRPRVSAKQ